MGFLQNAIDDSVDILPLIGGFRHSVKMDDKGWRGYLTNYAAAA